MSERRIPDPIKRIVRKEGYFGCCKCGNPIIEYHHITPWSVVHEHKIDNLMALCPRCHHEATCGHIDEEMAIKYKKTPFNKNKPYVTEMFLLRNYDRTEVVLGGNTFRNVPYILTCDNQNLISLHRGSDNEALLNAKFFDEHGILIAEILNNEWKAYINENVWDIQYSPGHLKINHSLKKIALELEVKSGKIYVSGRMYMNGYYIRLYKDSIEVNGKTVLKATMINCSFVNSEYGIVLN